MTDQHDCLVCGRTARPTGEPDCDCLTHSLSLPVSPPSYGPDPADVALFPVDGAPGDEPGKPFGRSAFRARHAHRKPRRRTRIAAAAGGAVAAAAMTALAATLLTGQGRPEPDRPATALPDGDPTPDEEPGPEQDPARGEERSPAPGQGEEPHRPDGTGAPDGSGGQGGTGGSAGSGGDGPAPDEETASRPPDTEEPGTPSPTPDAEEPDPSPSEPPPATPEDSSPTPAEPPPPPTDTATIVLHEGDRGPEVAELQRRLRQLNWLYFGEAHGRYNSETREAVATFQQANAITTDPAGAYGPDTRLALERQTSHA